MQRWRDRGDRELPWLAGPGLSALNGAGAGPTPSPRRQILERFLVGAETDPQRVRGALEESARSDAPAWTETPDARGALARATDRFFELLGRTYAACHRPVRDGYRHRVDEAVAQWQDQLDAAATQIEERALVLQGRTPQPAVAPRRVKDRAGFAVAFAILALLAAGAVLWLVQQGWPMTPVDLPF